MPCYRMTYTFTFTTTKKYLQAFDLGDCSAYVRGEERFVEIGSYVVGADSF